MDAWRVTRGRIWSEGQGAIGCGCNPVEGGIKGSHVVKFSLSNTDAVDWLRKLPDASVDLIITDPPYESLEKHRKIGTTTRLKNSKASSNKWFEIFPNDRFEELFAECFRVLKKNRHFYLHCDAETMFVAKPIGEAAGFKFWKPIVWDKVAIGMGYHYRARYEFVLFFEKGKRKLNNLGIPDVLTAKRVYRGYPTEKPVELTSVLVGQSTQPGELVIDPFTGSGASGLGAIKNGCSFAGNDLCAEAVDISRSRFEETEARECDSMHHFWDEPVVAVAEGEAAGEAAAVKQMALGFGDEAG